MKVEYEGLDAVVAVDSGAGAARSACRRGPARRRREPARLPAAQARALRPGARDLLQVLDGRRSRGAAGLPAAGRESRSARSCVAGRTEKAELVTQWLSERGDTTIRQIAKKWGVPSERRRGVPRGAVRVPCGPAAARAGEAEGVEGQPAAERERRLSGRCRPLAPAAEPRRLALSSPAGGARRDARRIDRCPAWRCDGELEFVARGSGQLRPAAARPGLLDAPARGAHGDGAARRARAAREPVQGRLGRDQRVRLHADARARRRHRPARRRADAQRAAAAGQLLAARRPRRPPASHGRGPDLLPARLPRPRVLRRAAQDARGPGRSARVQPAQRPHGRQARARDGHHAAASVRARRDALRGRAPERRRRRCRTCLPDRVSSYLFDDGIVRDDALRPGAASSADRPERRRSGRATWRAPSSRAGQTPTPRSRRPEACVPMSRRWCDGLDEVVARLERRLRWAMEQIKRLNVVRETAGRARAGGRSAVQALRRARQAAEGHGAARASRGRGLRRRQHLWRARGRGLPARDTDWRWAPCSARPRSRSGALARWSSRCLGRRAWRCASTCPAT